MVTALVFIKIDYSLKIKEIVVGVNVKLKRYNGYLNYKDVKTRKVRFTRYKSSV